MTYANHKDTENTENAQSIYWGTHKDDLCVASVFSVTPWLAYVNNWRICGT